MTQASQQVPDLQEAEEIQRRRRPGIVLVAAGTALWISMAIVGVTTLRPELATVRRMAVRVATGVPFLSPQDFAQAPALPAPSSSASAGATRPPVGWWRYTDPAGFSVNLPDGWSRTYRSASQVRFTDPSQRGAAIVVAYTPSPEPDQYIEWEEQSARRGETDPSYFVLGIQRVNYRGYNCASWEFLDEVRGAQTHFLDQGFISAPGKQAYAIELAAPAATWPRVKSAYWEELLTSFAPATTGKTATPSPPRTSASPRTTGTGGSPGMRTATRTPATPTQGTPSHGPPSQRTPTQAPTSLPTSLPTSVPTAIPSGLPTSIPSGLPTSLPTSLPSSFPTSLPRLP